MAAGAYCSACAFLTTTISLNRKRTKLLVFASTSTTEKPTKQLRRKNYLRPKILKTSTKPYSPPPTDTVQNPIIPIISPEITQRELLADESGDTCVAAASGEDDTSVDEFRFSETSLGYNDGVAGKISTRSVIEFGFFLFGAFVFQTIWAVLVLGNSNFDTREKGKVLLNGNGKIQASNSGSQKINVGFVDEWELEGKIDEIRSMAREARKSEEKKVNENTSSGVVVNQSSNSRDRTGIEKEIGRRLKKLQKKLSSDREKSLGSYANYLGKSQKGEEVGVNRNNTELKDSNGTLIFKKRFKFRSPSAENKKGPKGFGASQENKASQRKKGELGGLDETVENEPVGGGAIELFDSVNEEIKPEVDMEEDDNKSLVIEESILSQNDQKTKGAKEMGDGISKPRKVRNGIIQESGRGRSSIEVESSEASSELGKDSKIFLKENEKNVMEFNHLSLNGSQINRKTENKLADHNVQGKKLNDMWWLNLPYVLVVLMCRGSQPEGPEGFYTLKIPSESQDQDNSISAYTVAFEDRGDANNFCFLLECFFEDLGDFRADIVPLSVKELHEAVNSNRWKVIVVRKGQLQLYAGQPFDDVEAALHSLVEESQIE